MCRKDPNKKGIMFKSHSNENKRLCLLFHCAAKKFRTIRCAIFQQQIAL